MPERVAVVGGGVIGLSCAWRLAQAGLAVTVFDAASEAREASWAAAGMLAPHHEAESCDDRWRMGVASLLRWSTVAEELGGCQALDLQLGDGLLPLLQPSERPAAAAHMAALAAAGTPVTWLSRQELLQLEPGFGPAVEGAWLLPGGHVDPRRLVARLRRAGEVLGVVHAPPAAVTSIRPGRVTTATGEHSFMSVVVAAGAWTPALARTCGLVLAGEPVKGQLLRLQARVGLLGRFVHCPHAYLVPRQDGSVVVGATAVMSGFDKAEDRQAIELLAATARAILPSLRDAPITETWTGLRPRLAGGRPVIGPAAPGLVLATGHYRNGVLLAPITADAVTAWVVGTPPPEATIPFAALPGTSHLEIGKS